jgi:hypothetical protein
MPRPFVVRRARGPAWEGSKPLEAQVDWPAHAAFMDGLVAEGFVVLGGPLEGAGEALLVVRADDAAEIERRLAGDPWSRRGLMTVVGCWPWMLRLGALP